MKPGILSVPLTSTSSCPPPVRMPSVPLTSLVADVQSQARARRPAGRGNSGRLGGQPSHGDLRCRFRWCLSQALIAGGSKQTSVLLISFALQPLLLQSEVTAHSTHDFLLKSPPWGLMPSSLGGLPRTPGAWAAPPCARPALLVLGSVYWF